MQLLSAGSITLFGSLAYAMDSLPIGVTPLSLGTLEGMPPLRLVGAVGGGGGAYSHAPSGLFIGADTGWAVMLGEGTAPARDAWTFGARAGYEWRNGLALEARFDDLGVAPPLGGGPLLTATGGVRYSMPFIVMPFAEALIGPAFNGTHVAPAAGIGLGASLPVLRHLMFDLSVRDWIADIDGAVRNTPTVELGITVGFAGR
jgi:hypothetical protein